MTTTFKFQIRINSFSIKTCQCTSMWNWWSVIAHNLMEEQPILLGEKAKHCQEWMRMTNRILPSYYFSSQPISTVKRAVVTQLKVIEFLSSVYDDNINQNVGIVWRKSLLLWKNTVWIFTMFKGSKNVNLLILNVITIWFNLKRQLTQKLKFCHHLLPLVVPNQNDFISSAKHKWMYSDKCLCVLSIQWNNLQNIFFYVPQNKDLK